MPRSESVADSIAPPVDTDHRPLVLGLGTGRCGTHTLAELLHRQPNALVTHEQPPRLPWTPTRGRSGIRERLRRLRNTPGKSLVGDVASFYLPYVEEAIAVEPDVRFICVERPREEVVASFCRWLDTVHPLPTNHWADRPAAGWYHDPVWSRIFPQYDTTDREEGLRRYWDEYHQTTIGLARRFPAHFRIFPVEALNSEPGVRDILRFAGVPEDQQVVLPRLREGTMEKTRPHPRRAVLDAANPGDPCQCVVLVPYTGHIAPACEAGLRELERRGYTVWRVPGFAAIDQARCQLATDALMQGFRETMWIDADVAFEADAVDRLRAHGLPIVGGVYAQKGKRAVASHALPGTPELVFGAGGGLVEIQYAAGGFLLVRREVYMDIQRKLKMPVCNEQFGRPMIPHFIPFVRAHDEGWWYLAEDYAFSDAARRCGYSIVADTTIRLWHLGEYPYGWEDAGVPRERFGTFHFRLE